MSSSKHSSKQKLARRRAADRIAQNKRTQDKSLDLSNCELTEVPAQVSDLVWLESLQLANNSLLTDLSPLAGLRSLRDLNITCTAVSDLSPLAGLSALATLDMHEAQVSDLSPLAGLSGLRSLCAFKNKISDVSALAGMPALELLYIAHNDVADVAPLRGLTSLRNLNLLNTRVADLYPLMPLISAGCPVKWERVGDHGIYVEDCPLTNPPPEIVKQGTDAILNYFAEREAGGVDYLYEAKMLILGEGGAGKTSLLRRLYAPDQPLPAESETTRGIDISKHEFKMKDGRQFRLNVWDFGGQQIYHATHQFFLTRRSLYVLLDDTRKDYKSVSDEYFKYWLELIEVFGGHSPTLIFQNEKDGRSKAIDIGGIKQRYDNVKELYAGDLAKDGAAEKMRDGIEYYSSHLKHIGDVVPARWLKVRADIEELAAKQPYVPVEKYFSVYGKHIEFNESKALLLSGYLHELGVFLHYQDDSLLARTIILQNEWATEAVFRILDDETIKKKLGRFTREDCLRLWSNPTHARMHPELLALMQNFELCYKLPESKPEMWLLPQLLPPAKPEQLADWKKPEDLVLRYKYDFLPNGIISRLTVRLHRFVRDPRMAWVTGVLFERDTTAVLAQLLEKGDEIELRARGAESKDLLSVVASDLDALNTSFQGLRGKHSNTLVDSAVEPAERLLEKVDKRIPCNCELCRTKTVPWFFGQKALLRRKEHNVRTVQCDRSFKEVDVLQLLDGVKFDRLPDWANEVPRSSASRTIRIFLASSSELREDRDEFELYFRRLNDQSGNTGLYLELVRWENFLDTMSDTRLQDEYNKYVRACDIFVSLFFTKAGKFTEEEFNVAYGQFKNTGKPHIYTFFKDANIKTGRARKEDLNSLWDFQTRLEELGHYCTFYENTQDLKLQFRNQLDKLLGKEHDASRVAFTKD